MNNVCIYFIIHCAPQRILEIAPLKDYVPEIMIQIDRETIEYSDSLGYISVTKFFISVATFSNL